MLNPSLKGLFWQSLVDDIRLIKVNWNVAKAERLLIDSEVVKNGVLVENIILEVEACYRRAYEITYKRAIIYQGGKGELLRREAGNYKDLMGKISGVKI